MVRRVFFSFHYERDVWRASQVRNSWVTKPDRESAGFWDAAKWEEVKRQGRTAIKNWINRQLDGTSVTVVLIGPETSKREWVRYEIQQSIEKGNGIIGIRIHNLKDQSGKTDQEGDLDFGLVDGEHTFSELYPVYDWVEDDGYENLGDWVEAAAIRASRPVLLPPAKRYSQPTDCIR
ncbi:MAG: TIR domain-containing protein [Candidatus Hodarchaeota archaeon]